MLSGYVSFGTFSFLHIYNVNSKRSSYGFCFLTALILINEKLEVKRYILRILAKYVEMKRHVHKLSRTSAVNQLFIFRKLSFYYDNR